MPQSRDQTFWTGFIDLYRENECLWRTKSRDYFDKIKKLRALQQLVDYSKKDYDEADINWMKNKIQNLRTIFKKEHYQVKDSQRSSARTSEVYKPSLWYYDLLFTLEQKTVTQSRSMVEPNPLGQMAEANNENPERVDPPTPDLEMELAGVPEAVVLESVPEQTTLTPRVPSKRSCGIKCDGWDTYIVRASFEERRAPCLQDGSSYSGTP
ncbi:uncharacterized protein LOC134933319 isoform X2 [Pseudophryne corroboree]